MEFLRLGPEGGERPAVRDHGVIFDLRPITVDIDGDFLARRGIEQTRTALDSGALQPLEGAQSMRVGAPIARPSAVVCIGQNYAAHAAESDSAPPEVPIVFFKHPSCLTGPDDDIVLPGDSKCSDWEVELVAVIGRRAAKIKSEASALEYVAGYTVGNDVSERHWQLEGPGGQWGIGKSFPTFGPLGPSLVVGDIDPTALAISSRVNGETRQNSNTKDMIFPVAHLIWYVSQAMTLEPGDLVFTGTPEGVALSGRFPYLQKGDQVEIEIEGLGVQRQTITQAD